MQKGRVAASCFCVGVLYANVEANLCEENQNTEQEELKHISFVSSSKEGLFRFGSKRCTEKCDGRDDHRQRNELRRRHADGVQ